MGYGFGNLIAIGRNTIIPKANQIIPSDGINAEQAGNLLITFSNTSATNPNVYAKVSNTEWSYTEEINGENVVFFLLWDFDKWILTEGYNPTLAESSAGDINTIPTSGWTYVISSGPAIVVAEEP